MEKEMEATIVYWGESGIMGKKKGSYYGRVFGSRWLLRVLVLGMLSVQRWRIKGDMKRGMRWKLGAYRAS